MKTNECIVVWCDSPLGLVSTRVDESGLPVRFVIDNIDPTVATLATHHRTVFDILKQKDGTKVAIPVPYVKQTLGWNI